MQGLHSSSRFPPLTPHSLKLGGYVSLSSYGDAAHASEKKQASAIALDAMNESIKFQLGIKY